METLEPVEMQPMELQDLLVIQDQKATQVTQVLMVLVALVELLV